MGERTISRCPSASGRDFPRYLRSTACGHWPSRPCSPTTRTSGGRPGGFLGVDVFFVISGFLITVILLAEWQMDQWLDVVQFWKRRALRLLPAVLVLLVGVWVASP